MRIESLSQPPRLETHAVAINAVIELIPKDGVIFAPDPTINLPLELSGARIQDNMLKADRAPRVGESLSEDRRAVIIAAEDARKKEVRAGFPEITT